VDVVTVRRGEVHLVRLDPTEGHEIQKTRPCLLVSPDTLNAHLATVIVVPLTTGSHPAPWRVPCRFQRRAGLLVLDQIRTVDRRRLVQRLGRLPAETVTAVLETLQTLFAVAPEV
jgi:mRNA interferase MazF